MTSRDRDTIDFGFQSVPREEKARRVRDVFDSVADRYDLMNDLMSFGIHRLWKRFTLARTGLRPGGDALDLAGGTGDLSLGLAKQAGPRGRVVLSDINGRMLARGRDRLVDEGVGGRIACAAIDAERLPFPDRSFDCVTIGFGLRNVTDKDAALGEMHRVLKPGGRALVLEFSRPVAPGLGPVYDAYSFQVLPRLGRVVTGDSDSYRYLAESIRMHPDQEKLAGMMGRAGFEDVNWHNLTGGVVALHVGFRY